MIMARRLLFILLLTCSISAKLGGNQVPPPEKLTASSTWNQAKCPPWYQFDSSSQACLCTPLGYIACKENNTFLKFGLCTTYDESADLVSYVHCSFFRAEQGYNITRPGYVLLPENISELNHYMCAPLHRKGMLCNECIDGFSPAVNSFRDQCFNCKDSWYGIPVYLLFELVPLTIFYLLILIFQINLTSGALACFIMYSQMVTLIFGIKFEDPSISQIMFTQRNYPTLFMKMLFTGYGVWNLDFFRYILPPLCVHRKLKSIHIACLGYISAFYPLCLVVLTWAGIELYDSNFKLVVVLCRPFHACFNRLRKGLNAKGDIINVFASFFLLAYTKLVYQFLVLSMCKLITSTTYHVRSSDSWSYISYADLRIPCKSSEYFKFAIPALIISIIFNIFPVVLIMLYPSIRFQNLLSKCRLDFTAVKFFVERFQGCYKDSSNGERDLRSFSGLYFCVRIIVLAGVLIFQVFTTRQLIWFPAGTLILISALLVASCKPYKKSYMNILDTVLLSHFGLLCYLMSVSSLFKQRYILPTIKLLFLLPLAIFTLWLAMYCCWYVMKNIQRCFATQRVHREYNVADEGATPYQTEEEDRELLSPGAMTTKIDVPTTCTYGSIEITK